jgi:hypothetical protein
VRECACDSDMACEDNNDMVSCGGPAGYAVQYARLSEREFASKV